MHLNTSTALLIVAAAAASIIPNSASSNERQMLRRRGNPGPEEEPLNTESTTLNELPIAQRTCTPKEGMDFFTNNSGTIYKHPAALDRMASAIEAEREPSRDLCQSLYNLQWLPTRTFLSGYQVYFEHWRNCCTENGDIFGFLRYVYKRTRDEALAEVRKMVEKEKSEPRTPGTNTATTLAQTSNAQSGDGQISGPGSGMPTNLQTLPIASSGAGPSGPAQEAEIGVVPESVERAAQDQSAVQRDGSEKPWKTDHWKFPKLDDIDSDTATLLRLYLTDGCKDLLEGWYQASRAHQDILRAWARRGGFPIHSQPSTVSSDSSSQMLFKDKVAATLNKLAIFDGTENIMRVLDVDVLVHVCHQTFDRSEFLECNRAKFEKECANNLFE